MTINGDKWYVLNVYMPSTDKPGDTFEDTLDELERLVEDYSKTGKVVVMGDFNACLGDTCGARGTGHCCAKGARLKDIMYNERVQLLSADTSARASGPKNTFSKEGIGESWIDHVFASSDVIADLVRSGVIGEHVLNVSDHLPVYVHFNVKKKVCVNTSTPDDVVNEICTNRVKWYKLGSDQIGMYCNETNTIFAKLCDDYAADARTSLNEWCNTIVTNLISCSSRFVEKVSKKNGKHGPKPFWSQELSKLMKVKKQCYKAWVDAGRPRDVHSQVYSDHRESKRAFRKLMRVSEAKYRAGIEDKIQECQDLDQREFWFILKGKRSKKLGGVLKDKHGEVITDPDKVLDMWEDHFRKLGEPADKPSYDKVFKVHVQNKVLEYELSDDEMNDNGFSDPISTDEISKVCKALKNGKAQDHCGITYEHFKYAGPKVYDLLAMLFEDIVKIEQYPGLLKKGSCNTLVQRWPEGPIRKE